VRQKPEVRRVLSEVMTEADWEAIAAAGSQSVHRHLMERVQGVMGFRAILFETAKPNSVMDGLGWGRTDQSALSLSGFLGRMVVSLR
jgi:hypothetical protein